MRPITTSDNCFPSHEVCEQFCFNIACQITGHLIGQHCTYRFLSTVFLTSRHRFFWKYPIPYAQIHSGTTILLKKQHNTSIPRKTRKQLSVQKCLLFPRYTYEYRTAQASQNSIIWNKLKMMYPIYCIRCKQQTHYAACAIRVSSRNQGINW